MHAVVHNYVIGRFTVDFQMQSAVQHMHLHLSESVLDTVGTLVLKPVQPTLADIFGTDCHVVCLKVTLCTA